MQWIFSGKYLIQKCNRVFYIHSGIPIDGINGSNVASQLKFIMKILFLVAKNLPVTSKYIVGILRQVAQKELLANLNPQLTGNQT